MEVPMIGHVIEYIEPFTQTEYGTIIKLILITIPIVVYAVFIFYFYRFLARKNIIELNLNQYNTYEAGFFFKVFKIFFYTLEYIIILPIITFFWYTVLAVLTLLLTPELPLGTILLTTAALIAAVRVTAYISENLSQDLAKMLPLTLLGVALTKQSLFEFSNYLARIAEVPTLLTEIYYFLGFIIAIELIMRVLDLFAMIGRFNGSLKTRVGSEEE